MIKPKPLPNHVICKVDFSFNEVITHNSLRLHRASVYEGMQEISWNTEWGIVESLPEGYEGILREGDKVWGDYSTFQKLQQVQKKEDGSYFDYVTCPIDWLHFVEEQDGSFKMLPGKFLGNEVYDSEKIVSGILIENPKLKRNYIKITHVPEEELEIKIGDVILVQKNADYDITIKDKRHLIVYDRNAILTIIGEEELAC